MSPTSCMAGRLQGGRGQEETTSPGHVRTLACGEAAWRIRRAIRRQGTISVVHGSERDPHFAAALRPHDRMCYPTSQKGNHPQLRSWVRGIAPCPAIDLRPETAASGARIGKRGEMAFLGPLRRGGEMFCPPHFAFWPKSGWCTTDGKGHAIQRAPDAQGAPSGAPSPRPGRARRA